MARRKLTAIKDEQRKHALQRGIETDLKAEAESAISIEYAENRFYFNQKDKGNSPQTVEFYRRFFKKFHSFLNQEGLDAKSASVSLLTHETIKQQFVESLGNVNQQTINAYLRAYRAFGNFCEESGLIDGFYCYIKEVEPPVKNVYTDAELKRLLVKPPLEDFNSFRNYTIIVLMLSTAARANTIINLKIEDVDLEEGFIIFNTTKTNKVARIPLARKAKSTLAEYIGYWRKVGDGDIEPQDYLFSNIYGEQLTRGGLSKAIERYNREHGVYKTGIHLFRHTYAKNWLTSGGDIISLANVLTHSELAMVKRYANLYGQDIKDKVEEHSILSNIRTSSGETVGTKKNKEKR